MQIFMPDPDLKNCAKYLDDKRLNKQIIECGQLLSTVLWKYDCSLAEPLYSKNQIYLPTHEHHPIIKYVYFNYCETLLYFLYCLEEYKYRFDKTHTGERIYYSLFRFIYVMKFNKSYSMQNHTTNHKHIENIYEAYRQELSFKWDNDKVLPKWTKRNKPKWYK